MEPLTAGAIALVTLLLNKTFEKTGEIIVAKVFDQGGKVVKLLKEKSPETASVIEIVQNNPQLAEQQPEDYGEAVLVERIKEQAVANPEIRAAVEALGEAAKSQPQLNTVIENWKGINIKGGTTTISGNIFHQ
ncbi:hypothetical protein [Nostoc sp. CHAB 5715]|uniref:hypothetical protein n=1 Tax=Nostoc sp. CHAB 5715 TaxID=2780400 RepID=UPI001E6385B8|nr:hypothetical protein [Nostoc sp. CHAB 5715]MCC5622567.1 hypothetical protein [Nostoc sp. CHAB 5715]